MSRQNEALGLPDSSGQRGGKNKFPPLSRASEFPYDKEIGEVLGYPALLGRAYRSQRGSAVPGTSAPVTLNRFPLHTADSHQVTMDDLELYGEDHSDLMAMMGYDEMGDDTYEVEYDLDEPDEPHLHFVPPPDLKSIASGLGKHVKAAQDVLDKACSWQSLELLAKEMKEK